MAHLARKNCTASNYDVLIVGGGVIGLSLAWELSQHNAKVCVVDRGQLGKEASWAGAGMIPPGPAAAQGNRATPYEQLAGLSQRLQLEWHERLLELTGVDNEYRRCGGLHLAISPDQTQSLDDQCERWRQLGIAAQVPSGTAISDMEPTLAERTPTFARAVHLTDEAQIRNPRHLRALIAACQLQGVDLRPGVAVHDFEVRQDRLQQVVTSEATIQADKFCLAAGSWSGQLAMRLGIELPIKPIRGQIVLLEGPPRLLQRNINVGPCYLTPRRDGRILVGSTQEDVGFLKANTVAAVAELLEFAKSIAPEIAELPILARWAGLRPSTADGLPYLAKLPQLENGWLATGHFRAGLQLSPATAVVMRSMLLGQESPIDATELGLPRVQTTKQKNETSTGST